MNNNDCLQFDKGIMRLSLFDPSSNQYETRILTLPELPLLESLENLFDNVAARNNVHGGVLRMTKSCHNSSSNGSVGAMKKIHAVGVNNNSSSVSLVSSPRRCQSNPNFSKQQQTQQEKKVSFTSNNHVAGGPIRSKRSISSAFNAFTGFIHKKIRPSQKQQQQQQQPYQWPKGTFEIRRLSSLSSISSLSLSSPASSTSSFHRRCARRTSISSNYSTSSRRRTQMVYPTALSTCENWWVSSPPISSF